MDEVKLRAWWSHRQGLDGRYAGKSPATVLTETGWARSVGGVGPYLTLFARAGTSREAVDRAVEKLEIHELPSARGCTYIVPSQDFALGLKVGQSGGGGDRKTAAKLGVSGEEIDQLCAGVLRKLESGPQEPSELREALGEAVRNLGEEGRKKGLTTTLPVALEELQARGEIRRVAVNGRLDQQRYRYALWKPNPFEEFEADAEKCYMGLARRFFQWAGPATLAEFQAFSGLGVKAAKLAAEPLDLEAVEAGSGRYLLPEYREEWQAFRTPKEPQYALVSSVDGITLLRRDVKGLLEAVDVGRAEFGGLMELPSHAIVDRGRMVGLWEFDIKTASIVWVAFVAMEEGLRKAVRRTEEFVRDQLGDARSFSLDSPKSREPRIAAMRATAGSA